MAREQFQTLSEPMYYILLTLVNECCGVDVTKRVKELSHGRVIVGPGTLYNLLGTFNDSGIIRETRSIGRRRWYVITEKGKKLLNGEYQRLKIMLNDGSHIMEGLK